MGVPALFRWLSRKYPKIVQPVIEDDPSRIEVDGGYEELPIDISKPNPNGMEFDNLYLDMNGIVHPCTHPEGKPAPETEEEMMIEVFKYTDRVVNMVRPRKLLMIAIDGVAPRAKMNQQRSRRFRAAQDAKIKAEEKARAIVEWQAMGKTLSEEFLNEKAWDSNAITPGTPFMTLLANSLRYWIAYKLNTDPGWATMQVVLSDASVPGEGEHKIMDFIRRQRTQPEYDPNTQHCIYGLDADLIMLSLATHEPHFKVLREDVFFQEKKARGCHRCGQPGHHSSQCTGQPKEKQGQFDDKNKPVDKKPFIFLDVTVLREYLEVELDIPNTPFQFEFERAIDDWVLLIFFVGNDFLPHLPSLEIREGAIDTLLKIWKVQLPKMGGYLTDSGKLDLRRAGIILEGLASREDEIFRKRRETEDRQDRAEKRRRIEREGHQSGRSTPAASGSIQDINAEYVAVPAPKPNGDSAAKPDFLPQRPSVQVKEVAMKSNADVIQNRAAIRTANLSAAQLLRAEIAGKMTGAPAEAAATSGEAESADSHDASAMIAAEARAVMSRGLKRKAGADDDEEATVEKAEPNPLNEEVDDEEDEEEEDAGDTSVVAKQPGPAKPPPLKMVGNNMVEQEDMVKLWEPGYRERYYRQKFGLELSDGEARRNIVRAYTEGLCWVLRYYYQGCPSWTWFYPYHYSPFAADFVDIDQFDITFDLGTPARPYEQLMGVFPAASRQHIPSTYHPLMTDDDSPIIDFYPDEFEIDMNGKKMLWQGVALLPFIERARLQQAMAQKDDGLTDDERARNAPGHAVIFLNEEHTQYTNVSQVYGKKQKDEKPVGLNTRAAHGVFGSILPDPDCVPGTTFRSPLPETGLPDIFDDRSISARYYFPPQRVAHRSELLKGYKEPRRVLQPSDRDVVRYGAAFTGPSRSSDGFHQTRRDFDGGPGMAPMPRRPPPGPPQDFRNGAHNGPPNGYGAPGPYGGYGYGGGGGGPRYPTPPQNGIVYQQVPFGGQPYGAAPPMYGVPQPGPYGGYGPMGYAPPPPQAPYGGGGGGGYRPPPIQPAFTRPAPGQQGPYGYRDAPPHQQQGFGGGGYRPPPPPGPGQGAYMPPSAAGPNQYRRY